MTYDETMARLEALGTEPMRKYNLKNGAHENQFGVKMGDLRALAKEIKTQPELASQLWESGNIDAMYLATLLMKPKTLPVEELDRMVGAVTFPYLADWLGTNVIKVHPQKETRREAWMDSDHPITARMGWSLTTERVAKNRDGLDLTALLDRIEAEMGAAPEPARWTMNFCLIEIGVNSPEHRDRAIAIGEKLGAYRDYPTSKGCTSPYAATCIPELVRRQNA
ncbi:MAG: DNA alkylation repair protein [Fimbriimonas sp.]